MTEAEELDKKKVAMAALFQRYIGVITESSAAFHGNPARLSSKALLALCNEAITNFEAYPFDKINRWLGFIQGVLATMELIDVDEEREFSRPLLHSFHDKKIPTFAT